MLHIFHQNCPYRQKPQYFENFVRGCSKQAWKHCGVFVWVFEYLLANFRLLCRTFQHIATSNYEIKTDHFGALIYTGLLDFRNYDLSPTQFEEMMSKLSKMIVIIPENEMNHKSIREFIYQLGAHKLINNWFMHFFLFLFTGKTNRLKSLYRQLARLG